MKLCESGLSVLSLVENHPVDVQIQTMNNCSKRSVGKGSDSFALSLGKRTRFLGGTVATVCLGRTKEVLCPDPLPGSLSLCLPLLLLVGCKPGCAGSEGLPATHTAPSVPKCCV